VILSGLRTKPATAPTAEPEPEYVEAA
jgi:hypothetical protein